MSYGFEIYNSSGEIVADNSSYPLIKRVTGSAVTDSTSTATISYTDLGIIPTVFAQYSSNPISLGIRNSTTTTIFVHQGNTMTGAGSGITIPYIIAYPINVIPNPGGDYGLQLFDASGGLTFDSRLPLMQINSGVNVSVTAETDHFASLPSGVTNSYYFSLSLFKGQASGISNGKLYTNAHNISSPWFKVTGIVLSSGIPSSGNWKPNVSTIFTPG